MALFKRDGSKHWWISIYRGPGKPRLRKSTGTEDENAARIIEQNAMMLNRKATSKQRAMAIIEAVAPETEQGLGVKGIRAFYEGIVRAEGIAISKLEWQKRLNALGRMSVWLNGHTHVRWAGEVTNEIAWNYSQALGVGKTAKTLNNEIGYLRTSWAELVRHGKAADNPWTLARAKRRPEEEKSGRAFTDAELKRILAEAKKAGHEWHEVCVVGLYTGLRMRDVETLRWEDVDMSARAIRVVPGKTKRRGIGVSVPMHEEVWRVMAGAARERGGAEARALRDPYVFPWRARHPSKDRAKEGDVHFADILRRAKVEAGAGEKVTFHCFRHTFVSWLAEDRRTPQDVRMRLAGHTQARTNEIYVHEDKQSRAAIGRLRTVG